MKLCLIADIHGNLPALEVVLDHAKIQTYDLLLNLGDVIGYGPFPEEVVKRIFEIGALSVIGNFDLKVLDRKMIQTNWARVKTPEIRLAFQWAYEHLSPTSRARLITLPDSRRVQAEKMRLIMTHGGPEKTDEHICLDTPLSRLRDLADVAASDIILVGHTHIPMQHKVDRAQFINPGSVGRPADGDPRASYAMLSIEGETVSCEFFRLEYDLHATVTAIRKAELPEAFAKMLIQGRNFEDLTL